VIEAKLPSSRHLREFCGALLALLGIAATIPKSARGQTPAQEKKSEVIEQMSRSFQDLVRQVSPTVVEVLVTGYGSPDEDDPNASSAVGRERSLGSGIIVDPDGYIITNYHVVKGADRVRVVLTPAATQESQATSLLKSRGKIVPAKIVGFSRTIDLAVLKVDASGLPTLPFGRYDQIQKGQIVLAFGSPEGLENSVTLGLVSSVLRQPDPDSAMVYIQTDAAINPGNSGGPLVDVDGNVLGIDTFIYTKSGGNEGMGFAIPSGIARYAYEQIRRFGRVPRRTISADLQTLTPDLTEGLRLAVQSGVIVSDVYPQSSAERAGLKRDDVIVCVDGVPVDNVALFALSLYLVNTGDSAKLQISRGNQKLDLVVPIYEPANEFDKLADLADPSKDLINGLGIVGVTVTPEIANLLGNLRIPTGVLVASQVANQLAVDSGLLEGDIVHALNGTPIESVEQLRNAFRKLQSGDPAALLIERNGRLTYLTFEME
jgi:serine protease Do